MLAEDVITGWADLDSVGSAVPGGSAARLSAHCDSTDVVVCWENVNVHSARTADLAFPAVAHSSPFAELQLLEH